MKNRHEKNVNKKVKKKYHTLDLHKAFDTHQWVLCKYQSYITWNLSEMLTMKRKKIIFTVNNDWPSTDWASIPALGEVSNVVVLDDEVPEVVLGDGPGPGLLLVVPPVQLVLVLSCNQVILSLMSYNQVLLVVLSCNQVILVVLSCNQVILEVLSCNQVILEVLSSN